jgi:flagellar basal-body rod modification protein FlgD
MTGSVTSSTASTASATSGTTAATQTGSAALTSLSGNFSNFLSLLMTQLQNQDPTSPLDANQFTSELVQFSSVEQQIATNTNLTQLIQLTQASQIEQSASMLGRPVTVNSAQLSLQSGTAAINFTTTAAEPVAIAIYNASGAQIQGATLTSSAGSNTWTWDGKNASGNAMADGAYTVTVTALGSNSATAQVPFTVTGTATAVQNINGTVKLQMGGLTVPFSNVVSIGP